MFNFFKKKNTFSLISPMTGEIIAIGQVPDSVFAEKMVGDGLAIKPTEEIVVAPCDGKIIQIFPTKHAIGIETSEGIQILIHVGLDTVALNGRGFESFIQAGDDVKQGDKLLKIDLKLIQNYASSAISPIVITNMDKVEELSVEQGKVTRGESKIMDIYRK
ncbi:PTS glucose transporter subunit IIA [Irregularibacter muris]|uniref:PTS glucose transporter subunit IIA n=1 Tax=Irregularibacter muris TaxID=1796619 RepID=A0AAE3HI74_9FIRM|nr:PTS glucose transporter subunit IIA [Irregularibacter muris]MCR1899593.1 PTS glucose transporter subunit IIA [Irregularibacter muris]